MFVVDLEFGVFLEELPGEGLVDVQEQADVGGHESGQAPTLGVVFVVEADEGF